MHTTMFRFLFWLILIYLVYRLVKNWFAGPTENRRVGGQPQKPSLDLSQADIEDARFREIRDESRTKSNP